MGSHGLVSTTTDATVVGTSKSRSECIDYVSIMPAKTARSRCCMSAGYCKGRGGGGGTVEQEKEDRMGQNFERVSQSQCMWI